MFLQSDKTKRTAAALLILLAAAYIMHSPLIRELPFTGISSLLYGAFVTAWALTVYRRIVNRSIRRFLLAAAFFLWTLFPIRLCRWVFFEYSITLGRYFWYIYYIPFIAVPLLMLNAALFVGRDENERHGFMKALAAGALLLITATITNDLHHLVLGFDNIGHRVDHHPLYFVIVLWSVILTISSFAVLIKRCRLSQCRKYWFVPVIISGIGVVFLVLYFINGGSPSIGGIKLYFLQEVYALLFIGIWESFIQIGLVPSNTGYDELFRLSHVNAALHSADGEEVYRSSGFAEESGNEYLILRHKPISGGSVEWTEDMTAIRRINSELEDAAELIESENDLLEEEIRFTSEKTRYETKNRLYDRIAEHAHTQLVEIDEALLNTDLFDLRMKFCLIIGTYVKRTANLMLIADESRVISSKELSLSVAETLEYMSFLGIDCAMEDISERELSGEQLIMAYDLFEEVIESALDKMSVCYVRILPDDARLIVIETDCPQLTVKNGWRKNELKDIGLEMTVTSDGEISVAALERGGGAYG